ARAARHGGSPTMRTTNAGTIGPHSSRRSLPQLSRSAGVRLRPGYAITIVGNAMRATLCAVLLMLASQFTPQASSQARADDTTRIVGTWKLVSVVYEDQETKARTPIYGEHPKGYQIATPEGRWVAVVTAEGRPVPKTDEERAQALKTMIAYSGRYRVEDGK